MKWQVASEAELHRVAHHLIAQMADGGCTIGLSGPLGAGKTALVRAILSALGSSDQVSSPTYVLEHRYQLPQGLTVSHWDLYRLSVLPDELYEPCPKGEIRLIEWPEKCEGLQCDLMVKIEVVGTTERSVVVTP